MDTEIAALSAQFQALRKKRMPEEELLKAPALTTYAGIAKSQATSKRSATRDSKPELRKWMLTANPTRTLKKWRRMPKEQKQQPQGTPATRGHRKTTIGNPCKRWIFVNRRHSAQM